MNNLVVINKDGKAATTSLKVADVFEKEHKNVLADVKNIDCSDKFAELNFKRGSYIDKQNQNRPMVELTRDGFTFLVMGYTGKKAAKFKEKYIAEFNKMWQHIRKKELAGVQRALSDYVSVSQFAEDNGIKKTFWCKSVLGNKCSRYSLKAGIPRQVGYKKAMEYQRDIVKLIFERMFAAEKDDKRSRELYTQLRFSRDIYSVE